MVVVVVVGLRWLWFSSDCIHVGRGHPCAQLYLEVRQRKSVDVVVNVLALVVVVLVVVVGLRWLWPNSECIHVGRWPCVQLHLEVSLGKSRVNLVVVVITFVVVVVIVVVLWWWLNSDSIRV